MENMQNQVAERTENIGLDISMPIEATDVVPLNCQAALDSFTETERQEVLNLANSIDVKKLKMS